MSRTYLTLDKLRRPELLFNEVLRKGAQGLYLERDEYVPFLKRAVVVAIDPLGGNLENPDGTGGVDQQVGESSFHVDARIGPKNPPNSVKARVITNGGDKFASDENLRVYWPLFPESISVPIKPGEYIYVVYEDTDQLHGLWISKVAGHEDMNYAAGDKFFEKTGSGRLAQSFKDTSAVKSNQTQFNTNKDAAEFTPSQNLSKLWDI